MQTPAKWEPKRLDVRWMLDVPGGKKNNIQHPNSSKPIDPPGDRGQVPNPESGCWMFTFLGVPQHPTSNKHSVLDFPTPGTPTPESSANVWPERFFLLGRTKKSQIYACPSSWQAGVSMRPELEDLFCLIPE